MNDKLNAIREMRDKKDWESIVSLFNEENPISKECSEVVDLYVEALSRHRDFDKSNMLSNKMVCLSSKLGFYDVCRLIFSSDLYGGFDVGGLVNYLVYSLGKKNHDAWVDLVKLLALNSDSDDFSRYEEQYAFDESKPFRYKKIFISGFGCSGTGALRSFLNEFSEVYQVPGSEIQVISGRRGLWSLYSSKSKEDFREKFLEFFVVNSLGVSVLRNSQDLKELDRAEKIIDRSDDFYFLQAFYFLYRDVFFCSDFNKKLVERSCQEFLDRYIGSLNRPGQKKVFLFNNVVNAGKIRMMRLVDNYICFAVTRDPRSQFASFLETQRPHWNVGGFLKHFKSFDDSFQKGLVSLGEGAKNIKVVRFEDVVFSEDFRQSLVTLCGLDSNKARRFSRLKPDESMENMFLHNKDTFSDRKDDFEYILKELPEHCVSSQYN